VTYRIVLAPPARRAFENGLPAAVAAAAWEFISGPLSEEPFRVGKPLRGPLHGLWSARRGQYRVLYRIDGDAVLVTVVSIAHRRDAYRGP
jgi:Cytotoxic translational repressor of toxin-antitoxin stability system